MLPVILALRYYNSTQHAVVDMNHVEGFETSLIYPKSIMDIGSILKGEDADEGAQHQGRVAHKACKKHH